MKICGFDVGLEHPFFLMAGPCVIESETLAIETAGMLKEICAELHISFIYKSSFDKANRSSIDGFRGPGIDKGLAILEKVKNINNTWKDIYFSKQLKIIAETICNSPYCEGDSDSAHLGFYHTINGFILDILENGQSPSAVVKIDVDVPVGSTVEAVLPSLSKHL